MMKFFNEKIFKSGKNKKKKELELTFKLELLKSLKEALQLMESQKEWYDPDIISSLTGGYIGEIIEWDCLLRAFVNLNRDEMWSYQAKEYPESESGKEYQKMTKKIDDAKMNVINAIKKKIKNTEQEIEIIKLS